MATTKRKWNAGSAARRAAASLLPWLALTVLAGCETTSRVQVNSTPEGARIVIDGADSGQVTPSSLLLSNAKDVYSLSIEKPGFNPVVRDVRFTRNYDVMGPEEAFGRILLSPCCCGFPLLKFLHPVDVEPRFVPSQIDATLEVAGQGAKLHVTPPQFESELEVRPFETYLDGKLVVLLEGDYLVTTPGDHELEIRATGYRSYRRSIHVDERVYEHLEIGLALEGQGLLLTGSPEGAKVYLDEQYQGNLGDETRRVKGEPGPHQLRVEADGYRPWTDVVQIATDQWQPLAIELKLEGQGFFVRKPEGLPAQTPQIQVTVDGTLRASAFDLPIRLEPGAHDVEILVVGREPRHVRVEIAKDGWIDLAPGASREGSPQVVYVTPGVRVNPSSDFEETRPQDVQILVNGSLRAQAFGRVVPLEPGDYDLEVRVRGWQPWKVRVHVEQNHVTDVWPQPVRE